MTRNFCVISHVDHGKSTLADRFLELTGTVKNAGSCYLDSMDLEKEKGITIKMHPVRMEYKGHILNLIDTPGHIDFSYEISRALACVEGAILLVDACKGIQAQTLFNLEQAQKLGLKIIGAVNKIDMPHAQVQETKKELANILGHDNIFLISAKTGENVEQLLEEVIKVVPEPRKHEGALIFDSKYDSFSGVTAFVRVFSGEIKKGDKIRLVAQGLESEAKEVGIFSPELKPCSSLRAGEIGYVKTGIKDPRKVRVGDTIGRTALQGYKEPQPVLFLTLYPEDADEFEKLKQSLEKLKLTDPSLSFQFESKTALGRGVRIGFLGSLQAEIILRRLDQEFDVQVISTAPQAVFKVNGEKVSSPDQWPDMVSCAKEPWVRLEIVTPNDYFNQVFKILKLYEVELLDTKNITSHKSLLIAEAPLREIIKGNFYDDIKGRTQGYASFSFENIGMRQGDLVKMDILIAGKPERAFSRIVARDKAFAQAKDLVSKLKRILPAQQFSLAIQASIGGKIIARETIRARRKDVTGALYGGDVTRKRKLLERQKKGKKKLKARADVRIPANAYLEILKP